MDTVYEPEANYYRGPRVVQGFSGIPWHPHPHAYANAMANEEIRRMGGGPRGMTGPIDQSEGWEERLISRNKSTRLFGDNRLYYQGVNTNITLNEYQMEDIEGRDLDLYARWRYKYKFSHDDTIIMMDAQTCQSSMIKTREDKGFFRTYWLEVAGISMIFLALGTFAGYLWLKIPITLVLGYWIANMQGRWSRLKKLPTYADIVRSQKDGTYNTIEKQYLELIGE